MSAIDENQVRYTLAAENKNKPFNWLFIPGGPGADSSYLNSLAQLLELPGKAWLIDFPGNGSNKSDITDYDQWLEIFLPTIDKFDNPIIIGHSFGGMITLLYPQLESMLKGVVILNSSPKLWLEEAVKHAKEHNLPDLSADMAIFVQNPNHDTFHAALDACMPYYFPAHSLENGRNTVFANLPMTFEPAVWWQTKAIAINYSAKWIPSAVPAMIIGAQYDAITPFTVFQNDERFHRSNIQMHFIKDAGHIPWLEQPGQVKALFDSFCDQLI